MNIKTALVIINCIFLTIGACGTPLMMRLYFANGGERIWFSSFLQTSGFPIILFPLLLCFLRRREEEEEEEKTPFFIMKPPLFIASIVIGLLMGFDNYLYSYGLAYIPVSTSFLIISAELGFTALFAYFMVKQKFTPYTINDIVLLTVGAVVLALNSDSDKLANETHKEYVVGFLMTAGAALLYSFILPLVELTYKKARQQVTYTLVLEFQMVMCFVATCTCLVGMLAVSDFKVIIAREAREYKLGESLYYVVVVFIAVIWQAFFVGTIGLIFCVSSLVSRIMISALLLVTVMLAVICFPEKFQAGKGVSMALSLWGSVSYFYGQFKSEEKTKAQDQETPQLSQLPVTDSVA